MPVSVVVRCVSAGATGATPNFRGLSDARELGRSRLDVDRGMV